MRQATAAPELSRPVPADSIGAQRQTRRIEAGRDEREGLARRFALLALDRLEAEIELYRGGDDVIRLHGRMIADAVQSCVVSLAPVPAHLDVAFDATYSAEATGAAEAEVDPLGEDPPEPIAEGVIDLGEAVAQQLAVALDPYPRAPGTAASAAAGAETERPSPFAALASMKKPS
jgi:uncharacterized metal-binding protein YceD (DUF177 family)